MMQILQFPIQESLTKKTRTQKCTEPEDYALTILELKSASETAQEEVRALKDQQQEQEQELEMLIAQMEKLRTQTIETEQENHLLRHTLLTNQRTCSELKQEVVDLKSEHVTRMREHQDLKEELAILQEENIKLQDQQTQLRHSLTESTALCHAHQTNYNALKQNYQTLQDDLKNNQHALLASHSEQERLEAKSITLLQDCQNLIMALSNLTEGFYDIQLELLFAKQLLIEKTQKSADFFLLQDKASTRIKQLEETLKTAHENVSHKQSTIEKLEQNETQLLKRLEEETEHAKECAAMFKKDYTQALYQAQAAQEELNRYRTLQERLLPLQHCFLTLSPLLQSDKTALAAAVSPNSTGSAFSASSSSIDFQDGAWEEERYAHGYRPTKNLFIDP